MGKARKRRPRAAMSFAPREVAPRSRSPRMPAPPSQSPGTQCLLPAKPSGLQQPQPSKAAKRRVPCPPQFPPPGRVKADGDHAVPTCAPSPSRPEPVAANADVQQGHAEAKQPNFEPLVLAPSRAAGDDPPIQLRMGVTDITALKLLLDALEKKLTDLIPEERRSPRWKYERFELAAAMVAQKLHNWVVQQLWNEQCSPPDSSTPASHTQMQ